MNDNAGTPSSPEKTRIAFIDIGRSLAALMVVYSHIPARSADERPQLFGFLETFTSEPLHVQLQGAGQIAVPFFFLVSGYVVTPLAIRQGHYRFGIGRVIRVYLPLAFVLILTAAALTVGLSPQSTGQAQTVTPWTLFTNVTLANYLIYPQVVLIPVAWTMIIEVTFYLMLLLMIPVLRRSIWLAVAIELTLVFVVLLSRSELGPSWSLFAVDMSYLPILITGQVIWAATSKRMPLWAAGIFVGLAWMLYVYGNSVDEGRLDSSYSLSAFIATLCFMLGYFAESKLKQRRFWTELSERTYSLYLMHALGIFVTLDLVGSSFPQWLSIPLALVAAFVLSELSYRLVERPSHRLARRLSRSKRRTSSNRHNASNQPQTRSAAPAPGRVSVREPIRRRNGTQQVNGDEPTVEISRIPPVRNGAHRRSARPHGRQPTRRPQRPR